MRRICFRTATTQSGIIDARYTCSISIGYYISYVMNTLLLRKMNIGNCSLLNDVMSKNVHYRFFLNIDNISLIFTSIYKLLKTIKAFHEFMKEGCSAIKNESIKLESIRRYNSRRCWEIARL